MQQTNGGNLVTGFLKAHHSANALLTELTKYALHSGQKSRRSSESGNPGSLLPHLSDAGITSLAFQNHVGGFFGNHDGWRVGVARDDARHDGSVGNAQPFDAVNAEA